METFPNQRMVKVHREKATTDFLGIKNENWQAASRDLKPHALNLYLYFAANADGYTFALSPTAIRQTIGMPISTYRDQFNILVDKGYLVPSGSNSYDFFELPQARTASIQDEICATLDTDAEKTAAVAIQQSATAKVITRKDREINNRDNKINIPINNELYPQRVIKIKPPTVEVKKKNYDKTPTVPKGEFKF